MTGSSGFISNSYALKSTFRSGETIYRRRPTTSSLSTKRSRAVFGPPKLQGSRLQGFWQTLARSLDAYFAGRTRWAVPEVTLRRSKHEIARCRRLAHRRVAAPLEANATGGRLAQPRS